MDKKWSNSVGKKWSNPGGQKPHWPWIYCQPSCRGEISCWQILIWINFFPRSVDHFLRESIPERVKSEGDGTSKKVNISSKSNLINTRLSYCFPTMAGWSIKILENHLQDSLTWIRNQCSDSLLGLSRYVLDGRKLAMSQQKQTWWVVAKSMQAVSGVHEIFWGKYQTSKWKKYLKWDCLYN